MPEGTDNELMMQVRDGQTGMLGVLFERHQRRLLSYFMRMTGSRAASEDLVQEVFVRMLRYRDRYHGEGGGYATWMYTLARHACIDHLRRSARHDHQPLPEAEPAGRGPAPAETMEKKQSLAFLRRALSQLPEQKREVLALRRLDLKFDEIAAILGCRPGTVRVRAHRALQDLRSIYQGLLSEAST